MRQLRRRAVRVTRGDEGLTLQELMVSMVMLAVVMTLVMSFLVTFSRAFTQDRAATESINLSSSGMVELSRVIRAGTEIRVASATNNTPVFLEAKNERMVLHAYIDTASAGPEPVKIEFWIRSVTGSRELMEKRCPAVTGSGPYWTFQSDAACTDRLITRHIMSQSGTEAFLFGYQNADGAVMTPPASPGAFTTDQLRTIGRVNVYLKVQADATSRAEPVVLQATIGIPNLGIDRVGAGA